MLRTLMLRVVYAITLCAVSVPASAQQGSALGDPVVQYFNADGDAPCNGCLVYFYAAGTTTPIDTYTDAQLTTPHANPVELDSTGRALIFLSDRAYKVVLKTAAGVDIWTADHVVGRAPPSNVLAKSGAYTVAPTDGKDVLLKADASGGAFTITLYTAVGNAGRIVRVKKTDATFQTVTLDAAGSQTIDGALTATLTDPGDRISLLADGANWIVIESSAASPPELRYAEGRLTLESGVPIPTTDQAAKTTLYYTPHHGNRLSLYTAAGEWVTRTFTEISASLAGCTASTPYDVFAFDATGTPDLELLAWTNATTRATALARQDGILVKDGDATRRFLGSAYCNAAGGQSDDTVAKRYVYNAYHRVPAEMRVLEATNSWTYNTATLRCSNTAGACVNQLDIMVGLAEDLLDVTAVAHTSNSGSNETVVVAIGEDSTSAAAAGSLIANWNSVTGVRTRLVARLTKRPAVGRHVYAWLEYATAGGTATWFGDNNTPTILQSGITATWAY